MVKTAKGKTRYMRLKEYELGRTLEEAIREGIEAGQSWDEIAQAMDVSRLTLRYWVRELGAEVEEKRTIRFATEAVGS